jgi:hypothetical protein
MKKTLTIALMLLFGLTIGGCEKETSGCENTGNITVCEACCVSQGLDFDIYDPVTDRCFCR